jgi:hypothetical protein
VGNVKEALESDLPEFEPKGESKERVTRLQSAIEILERFDPSETIENVLGKDPLDKKAGENIAAAIGVRYDGIQEGAGDMPAMYTFTDPGTGTTFLARNLEEAREKLIEAKKAFEKGGGSVGEQLEDLKKKAKVLPEALRPYKIRQQVEVETPKGWVEAEVVGYRVGEVGEDFLRIDVKTSERLYSGCHPTAVRFRTEKPTRYDVRVDAHSERDRIGIYVTDERTDKTIAEWWDDDAREMFEAGFFKSGVPHLSWEKPTPEFANSVLDYLEEMGQLAKE